MWDGKKNNKMNIYELASRNPLNGKEWTLPGNEFQASIVEGKKHENMSVRVKRLAMSRALLLIDKGLENVR